MRTTKKTNILASIIAGSALAFAGFGAGCSHNDSGTTSPNAYVAPTTPATVNPDLNQGGMEPGVGSGVNQRQNVNGVSTPNDSIGPVQQHNNMPAKPNTTPNTTPNPLPNSGTVGPAGSTTGMGPNR